MWLVRKGATERVPAQPARGREQWLSRREATAAGGAEAVSLQDNWALVAATVQQIRRTKDTVRAMEVSSLRECLREGRFAIDPDVVARRMLEEVAPV